MSQTAINSTSQVHRKCSRRLGHFPWKLSGVAFRKRTEQREAQPAPEQCMRERDEEAGFTLIELLVASAIIVVLSGLAVQAYVIYRESSYHTIAMQMMGNTRTAMEAGKVDSERFTNNLFFISQTPGPATAMDGEDIVPGLTLPNDFYVYVFHNPGCQFVGCMEDYVITRHCKSGQRVIYSKAHDMGETVVYNAAAGGSC
ncbi:MAG: prepilin-type N-terminal cleavage/methylation domain-containing protein [Bdellovibrionales bacterium]|nr:prepilin-type N-terminal cleavage/methylation domain-containing protein [Bdellovibrionales bacterium]